MIFPLAEKPTLNWRGGRGFGAQRDGGRKHAGCDLIVPEGTPIYAIADGRVTVGPYLFYHGTYAIEIVHPQFVARYCEIRGVADGIGVGRVVKEGELIAYVGKMYRDSMLHLEMFTGAKKGPLTDRSRTPFCRRADLIDPTAHLDRWALMGQYAKT